MHDHMLWRTAAMLAMASSALCFNIGCGGGSDSNAGRSTMPETQSGQSAQYPSQTQTTSSNVPNTYGQYGQYGQQQDTTGAGGVGPGTSGAGTMGTEPTMPPSTTPPTAGTTSTTSAVPSDLTDEQIIAITMASNNGEVQQAQLAKDRAQNPQVKKFADRMITAHQGIAKDQQKVLTKTKMSPMQNATSQQMASDHKQLADSLRGKKGAEFDKEYMDAQVKEHKELLDMLDNKLIPQAKNPDLKNELQELRSKVEQHLRLAEDIEKSLGSKP